jgi:hypothetical protein
MAEFASDDHWTWRGALLVGAAMMVLVGCKDAASRIPRLPPGLPSAAVKAQTSPEEGVMFRESAGEAIAPVVVGDDLAPVAAVTAAPGKPGGSGTLNGHPGGITRENLNRSIQGSMGALAACFSNLTQNPMVAVSFEAEPSGRPSLVRVNGAPPDAEQCIRGVVQGIRFPGFEGKGVQVDLPLSFHRVGQPAQAAAPSGNQPAQNAPPPLFMQP